MKRKIFFLLLSVFSFVGEAVDEVGPDQALNSWPETCVLDASTRSAKCEATSDVGVGTTITSIASSSHKDNVTTLIFNCPSALGHVLMAPTESLESLTLSNCGISSITIGKLHGGIAALKRLDLSKNNLTTVLYLGYVPNLTHLDLSDNQIRSIREGTFSFNEKLEEVNLANNNIKRVEMNAFERPVENIILDGNLKAVCHRDWPLFHRYVIKNNVTLSLPGYEDTKCDLD